MRSPAAFLDALPLEQEKLLFDIWIDRCLELGARGRALHAADPRANWTRSVPG